MVELIEKNLFGNIIGLAAARFKSTTEFKSLNKADVIEMMDVCETQLKGFTSSYSLLNKNELAKLQEKVSRSFSKDDSIFLWQNGLNANARALEQKAYLLSVKTTANIFSLFITDAKKHIDDILGNKDIVIFKTRLSVYGFLGIIKQMEVFGNYASYLISLNFSKATDDKTLVPAFIKNYLTKNSKIFTKTINDVCNTTGKFEFLKDLNIIKKKGIDFNVDVVDPEINNFTSYVKPNEYPKSMIIGLSFMPTIFNIFTLPQETWVKFKHDRYTKAKKTKQWLEAKASLYKMDLLSKDRDSREYIEMEKIVNNINDEITLLNKKITNYEQNTH